MDKNKLRDSLDNFHNELEKTESIETGDRQRLENMETELRGLLETETDADQRDDSIIEQLEHALHQFELTHPDLTMAIGHLLDILSQEGI
jgi:predicted  nucleic acid-binding Zn-ribbon protein